MAFSRENKEASVARGWGTREKGQKLDQRSVGDGGNQLDHYKDMSETEKPL